MAKRLSLILATYNRAERLMRCLESVTRQDAPASQWEMVIVNNNSSDATSAVVEGFISDNRGLDISLVEEPRQGLSYARNSGIEHSTGDIVAIIDDDEALMPQFVSSFIDFFERRGDVAAAGGRIVPKYESGRPRWVSSYCEYPISCPIDLGEREQPFRGREIPGGGNMAFRRSVLERYGVFDVELGRKGDKLMGGEESNLFARLRGGAEQVWYNPTAVTHHFIPAERVEREYLDRLWFTIGVSHTVRARLEGVSKGRAVLAEGAKWIATLLLYIWYTVTFRHSKGYYLILMRYFITRGMASVYGGLKWGYKASK